jgi:hypothetical protein
MSWAWLLLIVAAAVVVYKAELVNTIATAVTLAVCAIPAGWVLYQLLAEALFAAQCRRYTVVDARRTHPAPLALTSRVPLAIEAARPKVVVIEREAQRKMER